MSETNGGAPAPEPITVAYDRCHYRVNYLEGEVDCIGGRYGRAHLSRFGFHRADQPKMETHLQVTFAEHFDAPIVLTDVSFFTEFGHRAGCLPSGVLGFARGVLIPTANLFDDGPELCTPLTFDGKQFLLRETRQPIVRCRRLLLMPDGKATALLCEPDARLFVEQQFGREASMPAEDVHGWNPSLYQRIGVRTLIEVEDDQTTPR